MEFFNSGLFWFVEGILFCLVIVGLKTWAEDKGVPMPFWKWVIFAAWLFYVGFSIAFVGTSVGENEPDAAMKGGIIFGIIAVLSGIVVWRLIRIGKGSRGKEVAVEQ